MTGWIPAAVPPPARPVLDQVPACERDPQDAGQFGVLFVCTGNMCRSVIAERLARRGLRARLGADACRFRVASAGTAALDGCPVHPYTAEALSWLGAGGDVDADGAVSHALTVADVDTADLVLTAGREHRDAVLALRPDASRRAYLLREFARLAAFATAQLPAGEPSGGTATAGCSVAAQARHRVAEAAQLRGRVPYVEPAEDEIADPVSSSAAFTDCARAIDAAVSQALDALCRGLPAAQYRGKHAR
jgi:protein-tyrosine phosphatase